MQAQLLEASQIEAATARERLHRTERHVRVVSRAARPNLTRAGLGAFLSCPAM